MKHQFQQEGETKLLTAGEKTLFSGGLWKFLHHSTKWSVMRLSLTYGWTLLTVPSRAICVEHSHGLVEATVKLRTVGREAKGVGGRQLIQVIVGSETGAHLPVESIPHVHGVVAAAAGQTAEGVRGQTIKRKKKTKHKRYNKV